MLLLFAVVDVFQYLLPFNLLVLMIDSFGTVSVLTCNTKVPSDNTPLLSESGVMPAASKISSLMKPSLFLYIQEFHNVLVNAFIFLVCDVPFLLFYAKILFTSGSCLSFSSIIPFARNHP